MGDMRDWAKREVELACRKEAPDRKDGEWDYGCACYESALKAYESLLDDGHSGMSWGFTRQILIRLMNNHPLTPIEDVPEIWSDDLFPEKKKGTDFQCKRMPSLFKHIGPDGKPVYRDIHRVTFCETLTDTIWDNFLANRIVDEMFPITMPYWPCENKYIVYGAEYLTDRKNGDFDTVAILKISKPDGTEVQVNRYFEEVDHGWQELTAEEFNARYAMHMERERKEGK